MKFILEFFEKLLNPWAPEPYDKPPEVAAEEPQPKFRVVIFFPGSDYHVLQYLSEGRWKSVTETFTFSSLKPSRYQPVLGDFDELVIKARKFLDDPEAFERFNKEQDRIYDNEVKRLRERNENMAKKEFYT